MEINPPVRPVLPEQAALPLSIGRVFIWVSVILTLISGIQYVWQLRRYFKDSL